MTAHGLAWAVHVTTAGVTVGLFVLRLALDAAGRPGWRRTPLRWLPHVNDTLLLSAAVALVVITGWMPLVHHWLTAKVLLLLGYIGSGVVAMNPQRPWAWRAPAALLALLQVAAIIALAFSKPG